ncbi:hypothetical protein M0R45_016407 [Rubus argutus]|uniref:Uncharacterized protein n=1 Tax=Rubus argutus TaxID=59490 RepID=A0AAW1XUY3_RUBAR
MVAGNRGLQPPSSDRKDEWIGGGSHGSTVMLGLWRGLVAAIDRAGHGLELHAEAGFCGTVIGSVRCGGVDVRCGTGGASVL